MVMAEQVPFKTRVIQVNQPKAEFSSATNNVGEGDGSATITVQLDVATSETVTVDYTTSNGTALAGSDYTTANGALTSWLAKPVNNLLCRSSKTLFLKETKQSI